MSAADYNRLPIGVHRFQHDCKPNSTTKPLKVTVTPEGFVWYCHRCQESGTQYSDSGARRPIITSSSITRTTLSDYGQELWRQCRALGGAAVDYLHARHCVVPPDDGDLRWHPKLRHPGGYSGPALVGLVTDVLTGDAISLHRTWIRSNGEKADVDPPRLFLKGHTTARGVIRLWSDEAVATCLSIGEGIETCLAAAHGATPIWSCLSAGTMEKFPILAGIGSLIIFADYDDRGLRAANACASRWASMAEITIVRPDMPGTDIADMVTAA